MGWRKPGSAKPKMFFKPKDLSGDLLGFKVREFKRNVDTGFKNREKVKDSATGEISEIETPRLADMVWADVHVFTGEHAGKTFENAEISNARLVRQLKDYVGDSDGVLGRLFRNSEENGEPWELAAATAEDEAIADGSAPADDDIPPWEK